MTITNGTGVRHGLPTLSRRVPDAVRGPLSAVGELTALDADELWVRLAHGLLAEPGDGVGGRVAAALSPAGLVEAVASEAASARAAVTLRSSGVDPAAFAAALERYRPRAREDDLVRAVVAAARLGVHVVTPVDGWWPCGLDDLGPHAPAVLWVRGDVSALTSGPSVALVGARAATAYGEHVAMEAAAGLAHRGAVIVSGAAYGIDGAAHRAALAVGGTTVAFLAGGVDRLYPAGHQSLLERIAADGAVVSELPCGQAPTRWRFLQRNRLIAAASAATIVVEAGVRSGSLNTAGHAAALGRPVGAVPGPVTSATSAGCHRLLREYGAECVTNAGEMLELAGVAPDADQVPFGGPRPQQGPTGTDETASRRSAEETRLIDALSRRAPRSVDELARSSGLAPSEVMRLLGRLELGGTVAERGGSWVRRG